MSNSTISYQKKNAWLSFTLDDSKTNGLDNFKMETWPHVSLFNKCLKKLEEIGFTVTPDPKIQKNYKSLTKYHRHGKWKELEIEIEIHKRGFRFWFYQNLVTINSNGGQHDFDKYNLMPFLTKKRFEFVIRELSIFICKHEPATFEIEDTPQLAELAILKHCQDNHWKEFSPKSLSEIAQTIGDYDLKCNSTDRDKKQILSGQTKYFRDYDGRLVRGVVYHNINNMWWVLINKFSYTNVAAFNLFDATSEDYANRRLKKGSIPAEIRQRMEILNSVSISQLKKILNKKRKEVLRNE